MLQILREVRGVGAPGLRVDRDQRVPRVVLAGQQRADLELVYLPAQRGQVTGRLLAGGLVVLGIGQLEHHPGVVDALAQLGQPAQLTVQVGEPLGDRLGPFLIVPETGVGELFPEPVRLPLHRGRVQDGFHVAQLGRQFRELTCRIGTCHGGKPTRGRGPRRTIADQSPHTS